MYSSQIENRNDKKANNHYVLLPFMQLARSISSMTSSNLIQKSGFATQQYIVQHIMNHECAHIK